MPHKRALSRYRDVNTCRGICVYLCVYTYMRVYNLCVYTYMRVYIYFRYLVKERVRERELSLATETWIHASMRTHVSVYTDWGQILEKRRTSSNHGSFICVTWLIRLRTDPRKETLFLQCLYGVSLCIHSFVSFVRQRSLFCQKRETFVSQKRQKRGICDPRKETHFLQCLYRHRNVATDFTNAWIHAR